MDLEFSIEIADPIIFATVSFTLTIYEHSDSWVSLANVTQKFLKTHVIVRWKLDLNMDILQRTILFSFKCKIIKRKIIYLCLFFSTSKTWEGFFGFQDPSVPIPLVHFTFPTDEMGTNVTLALPMVLTNPGLPYTAHLLPHLIQQLM